MSAPRDVPKGKAVSIDHVESTVSLRERERERARERERGERESSILMNVYYTYTMFLFIKPRSVPAGGIRAVRPKEGSLEKLTKEGNKWGKRYFELENSKLHYYNSKGQKYCDTIRLYNVPIKLDQNDPRVIIVNAESRVWHLRAQSELEASEWLQALTVHSGVQS